MNDISVAQIKLVASLAEKKHRRASNLFKVEGTKAVSDTLGHFELEFLAATSAWYDSHFVNLTADPSKMLKATRRDLDRMSSLTTTSDVIAVYKLPDTIPNLEAIEPEELVVALDGIQDPGNLGTILRTCNWFGVTTVICSNDTVDVFNPKAIQATMGAITQVNVGYVSDLAEALTALSEKMHIYALMLDGENIYKATLPKGGVIVLGNEGQGVRPSTITACNCRLTIPAFAAGHSAESLNVAIAGAITLSQFRSREIG